MAHLTFVSTISIFLPAKQVKLLNGRKHHLNKVEQCKHYFSNREGSQE
jgi:hypothetical protein